MAILAQNVGGQQPQGKESSLHAQPVLARRNILKHHPHGAGGGSVVARVAVELKHVAAQLGEPLPFLRQTLDGGEPLKTPLPQQLLVNGRGQLIDEGNGFGSGILDLRGDFIGSVEVFGHFQPLIGAGNGLPR